MLTGVDPPLDGAVVLLEHVVQIWHRPMPTILAQIAFAFELRNRGRIRGVAVGVDYPRRGMVRSAQRFGEKALSRGCVLLGREKEIGFLIDSFNDHFHDRVKMLLLSNRKRTVFEEVDIHNILSPEFVILYEFP
jgi:hypothetical protein